jgi:hypothetical protein
VKRRVIAEFGYTHTHASVYPVQSCKNESRYESLPQLCRIVCQFGQLAGILMTPLINNPTSGLRVIKIRKDLISGTSTRITVHKDSLCTEAIKRAPRPFESIDDIESGNSFPLSMFGVSDGITNDLDEDEKEYSNSKNECLTFSRNILRTPRVSS